MQPMGRLRTADHVATEMGDYRRARQAGDVPAAWRALERAHILGQPYFRLHLASHWQMLNFALALRDGREAAGQILRLALVPVGSLTGRLPIGNSGRARINAFRAMPISEDLAALVSDGPASAPRPDHSDGSAR